MNDDAARSDPDATAEVEAFVWNLRMWTGSYEWPVREEKKTPAEERGKGRAEYIRKLRRNHEKD